MTLDALLTALPDNGTRVMLTPSGTLKVTGTPLPPALLAEVKAHKADIITALQEARTLAAQLHRRGTTETFAAELNAAREVGSVSVADWCAGLLALRIVRNWQGMQPIIEEVAA